MNTTRFEGAVECVADLCLELLEQSEDFIEAEQSSLRLVKDILCRALGLALTRFDNDLYTAKSISGTVKGRETRTIISLCGEVTFSRRRYRKAQGSYLPLDEILALAPRARLSPAAIFEVTTLALDLSYQKSANTFERHSGVRISKPSVGEAIVTTANNLKLQNNSDKKSISALMCEADGVWVSLQHTKCRRVQAVQDNVHLPRHAEISLAVDYSGKQKDRWGKTTRIDPYYHVGIGDKISFWESVAQSIDRRYDNTSLQHTLFATDGEACYVAGKDYLPGKVIHLYDRYHLFQIVRRFAGPDISPEIIALLSARRLDGALLHLSGYRDVFRQDKDFKSAKELQKLMKFLVKWEKSILAGLVYSLGTCEGSNAHVIAARCKRLGRSWGMRRLGALCLLLAHTHSGKALPKARRKTRLLLQTEPARKSSALPPIDNDARKYEVDGNHYYHQVRFSDEQIASKVHSWKNEWKYI